MLEDRQRHSHVELCGNSRTLIHDRVNIAVDHSIILEITFNRPHLICFFPSSEISNYPMHCRQKVHRATCINYEATNKQKEETRLNYKAINSEPGREGEGDKKLKESAEEITEVIKR